MSIRASLIVPRARRIFASIAFAAVASLPASAQQLPFDLPPPYDGAYFDPGQPGIGLWLDNGPDGSSFGALMYYAADGRPTFATFASRLGTTGSLGESFTAVRGLRGPLWQSIDGQCLGCPWRAPRSSPLDGTFLTDIGHRDARVTWTGASFRMGAIPFGRPDQALLEGTWWLALDDRADRRTSDDNSPFTREIHELQAVVRIAPLQGVRFAPASSPGDPRYPTADSIIHGVSCIASCGDFDAWRRSAGETARVFAFGSGAISHFNNATFARWVEGPDGFVPAPDSLLHNLKLDAWAMHSVHTSADLPRTSRLALYRSPVTAPCDGDVLCRSQLDRPGDAAPDYESAGDRYAWLTRGLSGAFLDPAQPGTGLWIDAGRDGNTFMTLMTYAARADGGADPVFYTLGGPIAMQGDGMLATPGVHSPLYESRDGLRIGGAWRAPTTRVASELGPALVTLQSRNAVRLEVAGATYSMVALRPDRDAAAIPAGRWLLTLRDQLEYDGALTTPSGEPHARVEALTAQVEVVSDSIIGVYPADGSSTLRPGNGARSYAVQCTASCGDFDQWRAGHSVGLWVDRDGRAILSQTARQAVIGTYVPATARQYALVLQDDAIDGFALPLARPVAGRSVNRGELRMHRNPPQAFCDSDAYCE